MKQGKIITDDYDDDDVDRKPKKQRLNEQNK